MELRMRPATTLAEELFILQTMGDDRSVAEVYVAGKPIRAGIDKPGAANIQIHAPQLQTA